MQSLLAVARRLRKARDLIGSFHPGLSIVDVGKDVVVIFNGAADVTHNEHYLVDVILPVCQHVSNTQIILFIGMGKNEQKQSKPWLTPNALVIGIILS